MKRWFAIIAFVIGGATLFACVLFYNYTRGLSQAQRLVRGDQTVTLVEVQIDYQCRRVICTDPVALRYLENGLRGSDPDARPLGCTYSVRLFFGDGASLEVTTYWSRAGFSISMPDEDPYGENWPTRNVVFQPPVPPAVAAMVSFLDRPWQEVQGVVLCVEPGGIRRDFQKSLVPPS